MAAVRGSDVAWGRGVRGGGFGRRRGAPRPRGRPTPGALWGPRAQRWSRSVEPPGCGWGVWASRLGAGELRCKMAAARWPRHHGRRRLGPRLPAADAALGQIQRPLLRPLPRGNRFPDAYPREVGGNWREKARASGSALCCRQASLLLTEKPSAKILWGCDCALAVRLLVKQ